MIKKLSGLLCAVALSLTLFACGGNSNEKTADLNQVLTQIESQITLGDMVTYSTDDLKAAYGIDAADVKQSVAKVASDGLKADEIIMIEAVDAAAATRIEEKLQAHYEAKSNENITYNPEQYAMIQKCSVKRDGNFVTLFLSAHADQMTSAFEAALQ